MIIGYARVSSLGQNIAAQLAELKAAGCEKVVSETGSGKSLAHRQLRKLLPRLQPGDTLIVTRLDRLARSSKDLLNILSDLSEREIGFRSLRDHWADTSSAHGRLLITLLAGMAEFERELLLSRTAEGRTAAMARGVKFGRKPALTPHQRKWVAFRRLDGVSCRELAQLLNVHPATISRIPPADPDASRPRWAPGDPDDAESTRPVKPLDGHRVKPLDQKN